MAVSCATLPEIPNVSSVLHCCPLISVKVVCHSMWKLPCLRGFSILSLFFIDPSGFKQDEADLREDYEWWMEVERAASQVEEQAGDPYQNTRLCGTK